MKVIHSLESLPKEIHYFERYLGICIDFRSPDLIVLSSDVLQLN